MTEEINVKLPSDQGSVSSHCSTDIHTDGSVELCNRFKPGGSQGKTHPCFKDGEQYLFAVRLACYSFITPQGGAWLDWSWLGCGMVHPVP